MNSRYRLRRGMKYFKDNTDRYHCTWRLFEASRMLSGLYSALRGAEVQCSVFSTSDEICQFVCRLSLNLSLQGQSARVLAGNSRVPAERRLKSGTLAVGAARNGLALRMRVQCRRCRRSVGAVSPCTVQKPPSEEYHSTVFGSPQFYEVT